MESEFGKVRIVLHKDSWLIRTIHFFIKLFTRKDSYSGYTTTLGRTLYVPNGWYLRHPDGRYRTLRHERIHMKQFRYWPLAFLGHRGVWRINAFLFAFCYLFTLPTLWTMRAKFEREGYTQTLLVLTELKQLDPTNQQHRERWANYMEQTFTSSAYGWMARKGEGLDFALQTLNRIANGQLKADIAERVDI